MKKILIVLLILSFASFLFTACTRSDGSEKKNSSSTDKAKATTEDKTKELKKEEDSTPVEAAAIIKGEISSYQLYNSTVEAENSVDVYAKISGIIVQLEVEEGDYVKKGALLARVEDEDYVLAEKSAQTTFKKASRDYERAKEMDKDKLLSDNDFEQVKYTYEKEMITWERAKVNLSHTRITAPIAGFISLRNVKYGDFINVNTKVFSIVDMSSLITKVYIPEKNISRVKIGQSTKITSDALGEEVFTGFVKMINPVVNAETGTIKVTVQLKQNEKKIKPGMFVKCHIITDTHKNTLLVTKKAIIYNGIQSVIFVVKNGIAEQVVLDVGFDNGSYTEALNSNLKAGDKVITVGQYSIKDGTKVKIVNLES